MPCTTKIVARTSAPAAAGALADTDSSDAAATATAMILVSDVRTVICGEPPLLDGARLAMAVQHRRRHHRLVDADSRRDGPPSSRGSIVPAGCGLEQLRRTGRSCAGCGLLPS